MSARLLEQVTQFLQLLEPAQDEMLRLFNQKRSAVKLARTDEMLQLAQRESELTFELKQHLERRKRILALASNAGLPSDSIHSLVVAIGGQQREQLEQRIENSRSKSEAIRRHSWIHWIISQRAFSHFSELLDLIAYRGEKAPTYSQVPGMDTSGGAILDASI